MNRIKKEFLEQMQEVAYDAAKSIAQEIYAKELSDAVEDCMGRELLQGYIDANNRYYESFLYFDLYYSTTAGRGDTGAVAKAMRELLEDAGFDYMIEDDERLQELEGVQRANYLVNLTAEVLASEFMPDLNAIAEEVNEENK